ncbi:NUDIX hydrolase N-terminal domain-containing protein [Enterococcus sp. LJL99]
MSSYMLNQYRRLLAIADAGRYYGRDQFDQERYTEIRSIALELLNELSSEPLEKIVDIVNSNEGYPTPKVDVRAFIKQEGKILLVEDIVSKEWSLPGGYAEIGISPKENVIKEVLEETGLEVIVDELKAVFDTNLRQDIPQLFQYYKLVFSCTIIGGQFVENSETSNMAFFELDQLPKLSEKRTSKEQLILLENSKKPFFE